MKKLCLVAVLFLVAAGHAQNSLTGTINAQGSTCATTNACVTLALVNNQNSGSGGVGITISANSGANTLQFEASADGTNFTSINAFPLNSTTAVTSTTSTGTWQINVAGMSSVRVRCSAYVSGTVTLTIQSSVASASSGKGGGGGTGNTTSVGGVAGDLAQFTGPTSLTDSAIATGNVVQYSASTPFGEIGLPCQTYVNGSLTSTAYMGCDSTTPSIMFKNSSGTAIQLDASSLPATFVTSSSTNTFTNKTYDTAGTGNVFDINGVAVTANTGTGAVARAASPTFTGTVGVPTNSSFAGGATAASQGYVDAEIKPVYTASGNGVAMNSSATTVLVGPTTMLTPGANRHYMLLVNIQPATAGSGGTCAAGNVGVSLGWKDVGSGTAIAVGTGGATNENVSFLALNSALPTQTIAFNTVIGTVSTIWTPTPRYMYVASGTAFQYQIWQTTGTNCTTPPTFNWDVQLYDLGY